MLLLIVLLILLFGGFGGWGGYNRWGWGGGIGGGVGPVLLILLLWYLFGGGFPAHGQNVGIFFVTGQQAVTGSAVALPNNAMAVTCVKALPSNSIVVYVGQSNVTTSTGYPLSASESTCLPVRNSNGIYVVASTTGASVAWLGTTNPVN
jgi:hypothetical protein